MFASCVATTTVVPVRPIRSSRRMIPWLVPGSRLPVGSSARSMSGRFTKARATATRCCSPPESSPREPIAFLAETDQVEDLRNLGRDHMASVGR